MEALDGNAIAGPLFAYFGTEMTTTGGSCRHCGATAQLAELCVYVCAPGTVARCGSCGNVVMVLVLSAGDTLHVTLSGFTLSEPPPR